jgi:retron-type reverse transcriptase
MPGLQVFQYEQSDFNCVVLESPKRLKQAAIRNGLMKGSSKVITKRRMIKFGIFHYSEECGKRRNYSTSLISRKGSSFVSLANFELLGSYESQHLLKLKSDLANGLKANNLSIILSDPAFLFSCWVRIKSNKNSLTPVFDQYINGINESWFIETAGKMRNGGFKFQAIRRKYILKPNGKHHLLTMSSPKDKIIQEGMRFLLKIIFEPLFRETSYGRQSNIECLTMLNDIQMKCTNCSWFIKGNINQQFFTINLAILISIINRKINDQAFIDLLYKFIKVEYGENLKQITSRKIKGIQSGILFSILANIYLNPFDKWVKNSLIPSFNKSDKCKWAPFCILFPLIVFFVFFNYDYA